MAKRKRKAPKRKRRKGRFGIKVPSAKDVLGFEPDEEMKKAMMEPIGVALGEAAKTDDFKKKLEEATSKLGDKKEAVKTAANSIRSALETDMKAGTTELTGTKEAIKKTGEDGAEAFYKMIDASGIKDKMGSVLDQAKEKIKAKAKPLLENAGALQSVAKKGLDKIMDKFTLENFGTFVNTKYGKTKDMSKKIFLHILSKISYKDFQESTTKLLEEAGGAAKAAATAAVGAAKKAAEESKKKKEAAGTTTSFGKRKRGPSASLKRMCKKHGVRLTVKRGKKRVYKSSKVLKEQCQRKLKRKLKKNFGRKKIKRSGIMPPRKRKTRGKKRRGGGARRIASILKASARRQAKRAGRRARSAARYVRRNPGRIAAGLAGLGALGLGGVEARRARGRYLLDKDNAALLSIDEDIRRGNRGQEAKYQDYLKKRAALESPTGRFYRRGRRGVTAARDYFNDPGRDMGRDISRGAGEAYTGARTRAGEAYSGFMGLFKRKPAQAAQYGKRRRRRSSYKFGAKKEGCGHTGYGKRRRRKSRCGSFGKKAKKPSAALKKTCKRLGVRLTLKRGGKRVYKSEAMLKKQCLAAMKKRKRLPYQTRPAYKRAIAALRKKFRKKRKSKK